MPTRFDHLVIAVRDLDSAIQRYQRLGFEVHPGGKHGTGGTHNAIIRFGLDYIELLSVYDHQAARENGLRGSSILDALGDREEVLLGYALATSQIEEVAERFRDLDLYREPFAMQRARPDGQLLSWRLFVLGGVSWRRPWPFIIQWDDSDEQRLLIEKPGKHANGVQAWIGVTIAVRDLDWTNNLYQQRFGLQETEKSTIALTDRNRSSYAIGQSIINLIQPDQTGIAQNVLSEIGEGPVEAVFRVVDLQQTRNYLSEQGIEFIADGAGVGTLLIASKVATGVRLVFIEA